MSDWKPGDTERRQMNQVDHDLLITIANDCKHMKAWTESHTKEDNDRHESNLIKFEKINDNDKWQNKILYGMIGVFIFVEFFVKVIK